ncbi:MAG TPA: transposase [Polyangiaceae bacterium]|nr:transposase [Polyangiaceae bacterium]
MPRLRSQSVSIATTPYYHCVSRCVRRAFLCGQDPRTNRSFEHRRQWLVDRLHVLSDIYAVQVCAYAVMSNHFHLVLRVDREAALSWSDEEVAERYGRLFKHASVQLALLDPKRRAERLELWRGRLWDLSWLMRSLNEYIARRANKEDGCTGRFWEGRFKSQPLLDEAAVLTCMTYVDLNPVRAGIAKGLEDSAFTSIAARLAETTRRIHGGGEQAEEARTGTAPSGLSPFSDQAPEGASGVIPMTMPDYVNLVRWTGRAVVGGKGRCTSPAPAAIARLSIEPQVWLRTMSDRGLSRAGVLGCIEGLSELASRRGQRWVRGYGLARRLFRAA